MTQTKHQQKNRPVNNHWSIWLGLGLWLAFFYLKWGFAFGVVNNVEELPLIYSIIHRGGMMVDPFVSSHITGFNQATPYIYLFGLLGKIFGSVSIPILYFLVHLALLVAIYFIIRSIALQFFTISELSVSILIIVLLWLTQWPHSYQLLLIPNGRWFLSNFLDPELIAVVLSLWVIERYLSEKYQFTVILLLLLSIVHLLYTLPLLVILIAAVVFKSNMTWPEKFTQARWYLLVTLPYGLIIWLSSRQQLHPEIDPSAIGEYIRAPHHFVIPPISGLGNNLSFFSFVAVGLVVVAVASAKYFDRSRKVKWQQLAVMIITIMVVMLTVSIIASFIRIGLLISLTPYRMGLVASILLLILILALAIHFIEVYLAQANLILIITSLWWVTLLVAIPHQAVPPALTAAQLQTVTWIEQNTIESGLWLDYTAFNGVQTFAHRPVFFNYKPYPLTSDEQLKWYRRLLTVNQIDGNWLDYQGVKNELASGKEIDLGIVISQIGQPIRYLLLPVNGQFKLPSDTVERYRNGEYTVYEIL